MASICDLFSRVSPDAIFATVTSIAVLTAGGLSKWIYHELKQSSDRRELRDYFLVYLKSLLDRIEKRAQSFQALVDSANGNQQAFEYGEVSLRSQHISELPHTPLFAAVVRGSRKKRAIRLREYNKVVIALDYLTRQLPITQNQFSYFVEHHRTYVQTWHRSVSQILKLHRELIAFANANGIKPRADPFLTQINKVHHEWSNLPENSKFETVHQSLLDPIRTTCVEHQADPRRVPFLNEIGEAQIANENRQEILRLLRKYFLGQVDETRKTKGILESAFAELE